MKVKCTLPMVLLLVMGMLIACDTGGGSDPADPPPDDPTPTPSYYLSFKLDGQEHRFTKGLSVSLDRTELNGHACAVFDSSEPGLYLIGAEEPFSALSEIDEGIDWAVLGLGTANPLTGTYRPGYVEFNMDDVEYDPLASNEDDVPDDFQVIVTKMEAPGGIVEGTFSGTIVVDDESDPPVTKSVTDGAFSLLRQPDTVYQDGTLTIILENFPEGKQILVEVFSDEEDDPYTDTPLAGISGTGTGGTISLTVQNWVAGSGPNGDDWVGTGGVDYEYYVIVDYDEDGTFSSGDEYEDDDKTINGNTEERIDYLEEYFSTY